MGAPYKPEFWFDDIHGLAENYPLTIDNERSYDKFVPGLTQSGFPCRSFSGRNMNRYTQAYSVEEVEGYSAECFDSLVKHLQVHPCLFFAGENAPSSHVKITDSGPSAVIQGTSCWFCAHLQWYLECLMTSKVRQAMLNKPLSN